MKCGYDTESSVFTIKAIPTQIASPEPALNSIWEYSDWYHEQHDSHHLTIWEAEAVGFILINMVQS
jgi:hypothetical protein